MNNDEMSTTGNRKVSWNSGLQILVIFLEKRNETPSNQRLLVDLEDFSFRRTPVRLKDT